MNQLADRVCVVTGASRGIGAALVEALRDEGATVVGASRSSGTDVSRAEDVRRLFSDVREEHGRLDVLVNNAGVLTPRKPLVEVTDDEWQRSIAVNLTGVFLCTREALGIMLPARSGTIVNLSSGVATRAAPTWGPYAAAKWGVEGLTRLLAEEVRDEGIRVVSVNPGRTRTGMRAAAYPDEDPQTVKPPQTMATYLVDLLVGKIAFASGELLEFEPPV